MPQSEREDEEEHDRQLEDPERPLLSEEDPQPSKGPSTLLTVCPFILGDLLVDCPTLNITHHQ